jgi:hypothetical protein
MAKEPIKLSPFEARRAAQRQIAEIDLTSAEKVKEIFTRPEFATALEELEAIYDEQGGPGTAGSNVNSLIASGITLLKQMPGHADGHIAVLSPIVNGDAATAAPAAAPPAS